MKMEKKTKLDQVKWQYLTSPQFLYSTAQIPTNNSDMQNDTDIATFLGGN